MTVSPPVIDRRRLALCEAVNFRDIGGYQSGDGRTVKKGLVYRSDHLSRLTAKDQELLQQLGFKVVCDFRTTREQQNAPDRLPIDGSIRLHSLPVEANDFDPATVAGRLEAGDDGWLNIEFFIKLYQSYLDDFGPVWGTVLSLASSDRNLPLVFHCTGGKDRTGVCAALLLKVLGVSEADIIADHDLSNLYNAERLQPIYARFAAMGIDAQKAAPYLQAPLEPLIAMFEHLKKNYGTVEDYLLKKAGLGEKTLADLRAILLQ
jgi:protein-tyrosine phosphatase